MSKTVTLFACLLIVATATALDRKHFGKFRRYCKNQKPLICVLSPANDSNVSGKIFFRPAFQVKHNKPRCYVRINAMVKGLPSPRHGFHIHEYGDISNPTGASTGGHFLNPAGTPVDHGLPNDRIRHWGDFGNLRVRKGMAVYDRVDKVISLPGIVGRGITVHADQDMGAREQPTGASGARIGFCVIGFANPASVAEYLD